PTGKFFLKHCSQLLNFLTVTMSNSLLERVYEETVTTAKEQVTAASSVAILCDGWTNIRNEGIINFVITVPRPIFWSSTATGLFTFMSHSYGVSVT
ncbi:hypothetical protein Hamer_G028927, partial [Homarus americanus]